MCRPAAGLIPAAAAGIVDGRVRASASSIQRNCSAEKELQKGIERYYQSLSFPIRTSAANKEWTMARKIAFTNQKGGVGKTTAALGLAGGLTRRGKRVLLVDLDAQGNASASLGLIVEAGGRTLKELLVEGGDASGYVVSTGEADVLPSNNALKDIEPFLHGDGDGVRRLKRLLAPLERSYDFVLYDCPPSINVFTKSALAAADEVIVPVEVGFFAILGLKQLLEEIEGIRKEHNRALRLRGVLLSKFDRRTALSDQMLDVLREDLGQRLLGTTIRINVDLVKAQIAQRSIYDYSPRSAGTEDFWALTEEILNG